MEEYKQEAKIYKALMHPARLAILNVLREGEECVCHIEAHLGLRQAYISQQLMLLREAGLVEDRRDGWNIFYRVTQPGVFDILDTTTELTGVNHETVPRSELKGSNGVACPCPKCSHTAEKVSC